MASQRVTLSIPEGLYDQLMRLVEAGYYESLDEALRAGLRRELVEAHLAAPSIGLTASDQAYLRQLSEIRQIIADAKRPLTKEGVLDDLRRTRDEVWHERHPAGA